MCALYDQMQGSRGAHVPRMRLGIVGCGAIAESAHLPAALGSEDVEVTALSDTNPRRLRYLQQQYALPAKAVADFREMFGQVGAVVLAVPNALHASVGIEFLSRGIHVLCEKPLASSRNECRQLCEAARRNSAVLAVGYVTRFFPSTDLAKRLIEDGSLGELHSFDYEFGTAGGWETVSGYNLTRSTAGGGVLVISGSHFIDRMIYLFGDPEILSFEEDSRGGLEANCMISLVCKVRGKPLPGQITLSKTHGLANRLRICGERGTLEVREGEARRVTFRPERSEFEHQLFPLSPDAAQEDYFRVQLEDFVRAIENGTEPRINGEQGSLSVAVMEDCYKMATRLQEPWVDAMLPRLMVPLTGRS